MSIAARDNYLSTEVMTASPQKLQLMMIDAAIRACLKAREAWLADDQETAGESLVRAQQVVTELIAGVHAEKAPELARKVMGVYLFIFRALVDAHLNHDEAKLEESLEILHFERETWQTLCEQLGTQRAEAPEESAGADFSA